MQISTGATFTAETFDSMRSAPGFDPSDYVMLTGTPEQIETVSRRVALGAAEQSKRKQRRRQQAASRRANRR